LYSFGLKDIEITLLISDLFTGNFKHKNPLNVEKYHKAVAEGGSGFIIL